MSELNNEITKLKSNLDSLLAIGNLIATLAPNSPLVMNLSNQVKSLNKVFDNIRSQLGKLGNE